MKCHRFFDIAKLVISPLCINVTFSQWAKTMELITLEIDEHSLFILKVLAIWYQTNAKTKISVKSDVITVFDKNQRTIYLKQVWTAQWYAENFLIILSSTVTISMEVLTKKCFFHEFVRQSVWIYTWYMRIKPHFWQICNKQSIKFIYMINDSPFSRTHKIWISIAELLATEIINKYSWHCRKMYFATAYCQSAFASHPL